MHEPEKSLRVRGLGDQVNHRCNGNSSEKVRFFFLLMISEGKAYRDGFPEELTLELYFE